VIKARGSQQVQGLFFDVPKESRPKEIKLLQQKKLITSTPI